jgi:hypothetical protein
MHWTIAKEDGSFGAKLKFMCIVLAKARPKSASEDAKERVVGLNSKKAKKGCFFVDDR